MNIYVISLKESEVRRKKIKGLLKDIDFIFFDAVDLKNDSEHYVFSLYNSAKTKKYKGYTLTLSELGCFASHIMLWKKCVELNKSILIMEDNVDLTDDFFKYLDRICSFVEKYGVLKLFNSADRKYKVFESFDFGYQIISNLKGGLGTQAYAITPKVAKAYLDAVPGFFEPVDNFMDNEWHTKQTVYSIYPNLVTRAKISSTIGKRKLKSKKINVANAINAELYRIYKRVQHFLYNRKYK